MGKLMYIIKGSLTYLASQKWVLLGRNGHQKRKRRSFPSKFVLTAKSFLVCLLIKEITLEETSSLVNQQTKNGEKRIPNESIKTVSLLDIKLMN